MMGDIFPAGVTSLLLAMYILCLVLAAWSVM